MWGSSSGRCWAAFFGEFGPRVPFLAAAGLCFANLLYGAVVLPESLAKSQRRPFDWRRANPTGTLTALRRYPIVLGLVGAYFLFLLGHHALPSTWSYFTMEKFDWSPRDVGYSLGFVGVLMVFTQAVVLRVLLPRLGARRAGTLGFLCTMAAFCGYAVATDGWMIYLFLTVGALQGFATPAMQGIMSVNVPGNEQGELQGGLASVSSLTAILSPPIHDADFRVLHRHECRGVLSRRAVRRCRAADGGGLDGIPAGYSAAV
ncbi:MAG: MFS transporter [Gammaproteobacteria bacterium]|nr:MFS transporter [Gammaproteobacteria bacterium]